MKMMKNQSNLTLTLTSPFFYSLTLPGHPHRPWGFDTIGENAFGTFEKMIKIKFDVLTFGAV
jgi:hypothetical protein